MIFVNKSVKIYASYIPVKPYFIREPDDVTVISGNNAILNCEVGGDPSPTIMWHREDGKLPAGRTSVKDGELRIQEATPADEGIYVCQAESTAGSISVGASLAVHGKALLTLAIFKCVLCRSAVSSMQRSVVNT